MKLGLMPCMQCEYEKLETQYAVRGAELRDDLTFEVVCPHGHKTRLIYEAQKFEVLFDMGMSALIDGYCREAVSSFAAAQERFHEFCIKVFLASHEIDKSQFGLTWKLVANQSERQLGAYYFLHLLHFKRSPVSDQKKVEFRNSVIHKGFIPAHEQTLEYAKYLYGYITSTLKSMRPGLDPAIASVCQFDLDDLKTSIPKGTLTRSGAVPTTIWLSGPADKTAKRTFDAVYRSQKEERVEELRNLADYLEEELGDE